MLTALPMGVSDHDARQGAVVGTNLAVKAGDQIAIDQSACAAGPPW